MITSHADYVLYLEADRRSLGITPSWRDWLLDDIWRFQRLLRRLEYLTNCRKNRVLRIITLYRFQRLSMRLGFSIPINVFGPGLAILHYGTIVVNSGAQVGANCRLHTGVNIGSNLGTKLSVPRIGHNCYIAPGAKLFGDIEIGDDTAIGANAVVNSSFPEGHCTLGGIPARIISSRSTEGLFARGFPVDTA